MSYIGYLAPDGYEEALEAELQRVVCRYGRLFLAEGPEQRAHWVQNIWKNPQTISFGSIAEGAAILRSLGPLWSCYPFASVRRAELISEKLPFFAPKPIVFPHIPPKTPLGSWMLLDANTLIASPDCSSYFANGAPHFLETKLPPSRAYLKLWEFFTRTGRMPKKGARCLEIGASPGSWTWVLQQIGADVTAMDRALLSPEIAKLPRVSFFQKDAFSVSPKDFPDVDWVFSDVICYPAKLLEWLRPWLEKGVSCVCTLKFQGKGEYAILKEFEKIEGSEIVHLFHNKHELTWYTQTT